MSFNQNNETIESETERTAWLSCNMLSLKRFMHVAVNGNASWSEIRVGLTTITS